MNLFGVQIYLTPFFPVLARGEVGHLLEDLCEVALVLVAHHSGNLNKGKFTVHKQILALVDPYLVQVGVEVALHLLFEDLAEVGRG